MEIRSTRRHVRGFTLVELIMVIVILGLLAAIVIPRFAGQGDAARISTTKTNLETLRSAVEVYRVQEAALPGAGLNQLWDGTAPSGNTYLRVIPEDGVLEINGVAVPPVTGAGGWVYDPATGDVFANLTLGTCSPCMTLGDDPLTW